MNYHTLTELHLPHQKIGERILVGFADDATFAEVQFIDGGELVGCLRWECGASDEPIEQRFAWHYFEICRQIPPYCTHNIRTIYAVICQICDNRTY